MGFSSHKFHNDIHSFTFQGKLIKASPSSRITSRAEANGGLGADCPQGDHLSENFALLSEILVI